MHKRLSINTTLHVTLAVVAAAFFICGINKSAPANTLTEAKQEHSFVILDSMEAEFHPANRVVIVKGSIKNISKIVLRGHITLHILSAAGTVIYSAEMPVKGHQPIQHGESVAFDTVLNVSNLSGAKQISADFTWD